MRNLSGQVRDFNLPTPQTYEFLAFDPDGSEVWRWSEGTLYAQVVTPFEMDKGDSRVFKAAWNTGDTPPGKYEIQGFFLGMEDLRPAVTVEIEP